MEGEVTSGGGARALSGGAIDWSLLRTYVRIRRGVRGQKLFLWHTYVCANIRASLNRKRLVYAACFRLRTCDEKFFLNFMHNVLTSWSEYIIVRLDNTKTTTSPDADKPGRVAESRKGEGKRRARLFENKKYEFRGE